MKVKLMCFLLFLFYTKDTYSQLLFVQNEFSDEKVWRLSFKLGDAHYNQAYNYCGKCMDELLQQSDRIDKEIVKLGIECYDKIYQFDKIKNLISKGYLNNLTNEERCTIEVSDQVKRMPFFDKCENKISNETGLEKVTKPGLRDTLINMLIADQYNRSFVLINIFSEKGYEVYNEYLEKNAQKVLDSINQVALKKILSKEGFPTREEVGKWGMQSIFLIIQHAEIEFQKKHQENINLAYKRGELNSYNYATMLDRLELNQGREQIYGTQLGLNTEGGWSLYSIIEPEKVNERRMKLGLEPIEKFLLRNNVDIIK